MKFGKEFNNHLEEALPEWRDKFLCYKPLKKLLKHLPPTVADPFLLDPNSLRNPPRWWCPPNEDARTFAAAESGLYGGGSQRYLMELQDRFVGILNEELEKFNVFYMDKEEEFIIRLQELKQRIEQLKEKSNQGGVSTSEGEFGEEMDIRKDFVSIHGEMVLLKSYSSLNFVGINKILKKYDKRTGGLLRLPFTQLALHQPFFTTEPLTRLVHECEANLELLFPLKAEIVDSVPASIPCEEPPTVGEETTGIYRSTLAAMRAVQGLQKASSTYNPFSFGALARATDGDGNGSVTSEDSSAPMDGHEEADQEDGGSK